MLESLRLPSWLTQSCKNPLDPWQALPVSSAGPAPSRDPGPSDCCVGALGTMPCPGCHRTLGTESSGLGSQRPRSSSPTPTTPHGAQGQWSAGCSRPGRRPTSSRRGRPLPAEISQGFEGRRGSQQGGTGAELGVMALAQPPLPEAWAPAQTAGTLARCSEQKAQVPPLSCGALAISSGISPGGFGKGA